MRPRYPLSLCLIALGWTVLAPAQEAEPPASPLVVPVGAERVEVDLVVRDKHEKFVRDLRPEDVEVREDGVPQHLESFELVDRQAAGHAPATPVFLALAFDRLGPAARRFAHGAALEYLSRELSIRLTELLESRLVEGFECLERDQRGFGTTHALLALIGALEALPGRKAVVLFSEGLAVPSDVEGTYRAVIAAANRARVSLYTADAEGLRVASPADEMRLAPDTLRTRLPTSCA